MHTFSHNTQKLGESFDVTQFHYIVWPDHGVPEYATGMLSFYRRIRGFHCATKDPMLVHCRLVLVQTHKIIVILYNNTCVKEPSTNCNVVCFCAFHDKIFCISQNLFLCMTVLLE